MSHRLKSFGVRALLLVTKGFAYTQSLITHLRIPLVSRISTTVARGLFYSTLYLLSPFYNLYRRAKKPLNKLTLVPHSKVHHSLSHRYLLHGMVLLITLATVYANVGPTPVGAEGFTEGRLVLTLLNKEVDVEEQLIGLPALPDNFDNLAAPQDNSTLNNGLTARTYLSHTGEAVFQPYLPTTEDSIAPRTEVETYIVQDGDTPAGIAAAFQIKLVTLLEANNLSARSIIKPGQELTILPIDGLVHTVKRNENIGLIARKYSVNDDAILTFNRISDPTTVQVGQELIVPGGKKPRVVVARPTPRPTTSPTTIPTKAPSDSGTRLLWPTVDHRINQYYHYRHHGVDIRGTLNVPIYASENGTVIESRWAGAYGNMVLIKHDNGIVTRYAHHTRNLVGAGERVTRGQTIALMGSTGRSTGPHLHYEVIVGGRRVNPLSYTR